MNKLTLAITGASGFLAGKLIDELKGNSILNEQFDEIEIYKIVRKQSTSENELRLDPETQSLLTHQGESPSIQFDCVIHLAGKNISSFPWTKKKKREMYSSRITYSRLLLTALEKMKLPPKQLISASAIGIYGNQEQGEWDEFSDLKSITHSQPKHFTSRLCLDWEEAVKSEQFPSLSLRIGVVLDKTAGALKKMLPAYRLGAGGKIGSGKQIMSWISTKDLVQSILFLIDKSSHQWGQEMANQIKGPINLVSPQTLPQKDFSRQLAKTLRRPDFIPMPSFIAKRIFGQMGVELLLGGCSVRSRRLSDLGYTFHHPTFESFLEEEFKR